MVRTLYRAADGSALLIPLLVNGFPDGFRAVLRRRYQCIGHSSARQRLSQWFAHHIAQPMAAHYSYLRSLAAFPTNCTPYCSADGSALLILTLVNGLTTVRVPYCSAAGSALLIPLLVNGFSNSSRAAWLSGWQQVAYTSARQWL